MMTYSLTAWGSKPPKRNKGAKKRRQQQKKIRKIRVCCSQCMSRDISTSQKKMVEQATSFPDPLGMVMYHKDRAFRFHRNQSQFRWGKWEVDSRLVPKAENDKQVVVVLAVLLVPFFGMVKWPELKGCWWPPTRESKRSRLESPGLSCYQPQPTSLANILANPLLGSAIELPWWWDP